jgi:hypothetical protein
VSQNDAATGRRFSLAPRGEKGNERNPTALDSQPSLSIDLPLSQNKKKATARKEREETRTETETTQSPSMSSVGTRTKHVSNCSGRTSNSTVFVVNLGLATNATFIC